MINLHAAMRPVLQGLAGLAILAVSASPSFAQSLEQVFASHSANASETVDHSVWDRLLKAHIKTAPDGLNRVDYARFKADGLADLKAYVKRLEATDVSRLAKAEQFAFWANLYNAKTIEIVLERYPVKSIRDISLGGGIVATFTGGPWKAKVMRVGGHALSLDDVEHEILRKVFKDPRVHYAVNCASVGCPNLLAEAFTGAALERQLEAGAKAYVNHPRGIRVDGGRVYASSIFDWFKVDFGGSAASVLEHVRRYARPELRQQLEGLTTIYEYGYDWSLNDERS